MFLPVFVCLSVCLSVSKVTQKTDVGTWMNGLTFEPDPGYSPDAGTRLLSRMSYKCCNAEFYVRKIPHTRIGSMVFGASRGFKTVLFTELSTNLCRRYMRSTEFPTSFLFLSKLRQKWLICHHS